MRIGVKQFRGMAPRIAPHELPPNAAQSAINCRLQSGDLEAWRQFLETERLAIAPMSIYLLNDRWLAWATDVDVARAPIPGDTSFRVYLTGPDEYAQPRWTNYSLAFQSPGGTAPVVTRPIGVPASDSAPTLVVGVDSSPTTFSIDTQDDSASLATSWTTNSPLTGATYATVTQGAGFYESLYDENRNPGQEAYAYRSFGVAGVSVLEVTCDFVLAGDPAWQQAGFIVGAELTGAGVGVFYENGALTLRKMANWGANFGAAIIATEVVSPALSAGTTYTMSIHVVTNDDGTKTVTAKIFNGATELETLTGTNNFGDGDYCGFANGAIADAGTLFRTDYSAYHVQASGSNNATVVNVATSYVYTLVNDLGEESAPSPASGTILRPDGVSVTVTTPVTVPTGVSSEYGIETKRIYRAVTGATGSIFRFVAEIALATADYVDTLTDAQLGEALESEGWDLPPDDLQGIMALPNGIMVGFRANQLCFSAQNRPHAWPPAYRLNTDTAIVAIGAIDTAVVIGTHTFPYVAQGQSPADYAAAKLEKPQACVSKRSLAYLGGVGVCFASPDGYLAIAGVAEPVNLTRSIFTRKQWQALNPESIAGVSHDDVLHFFYSPLQSGETGAGYALDAKPDGFGLIALSYHATAVHSDPVSDNLYLALDSVDEPSAPYLPAPSTFQLAQEIPDGDYSSVLLLLHMDGVDGQAAFFDDSPAQNVVSALGGSRTETNDALFNASWDSDGTSGSRLRINSSAFNIPADTPWTFEFAAFARSYNAGLQVLGGSEGVASVYFAQTASGWSFRVAGFDLDIGPVGLGAWHRLAACYDGTTLRVYVDGVATNSSTNSSIHAGFGITQIYVGTNGNNSPFDGLIDEVRLTLDARYTGASYAVESTPFGDNTPRSVPAIYQFDGDPDALMTYLWRGRLNLLERPFAAQFQRVLAADFDNLIARGYEDSALQFERVVASNVEFRSRRSMLAEVSYEQELIGTSRVRGMLSAEDIDELGG